METLCRICSQTEPFVSVPLSSQPEASQENKETISVMFTYCTQLEVSPEDSLPQQICRDCLTNLTVAFEFKRLCHQSDASFRQMLQKESVDESDQPSEMETDSDYPIAAKHPPQRTTYQCCFKRCYRKAADYDKLREHAEKYHQTRRHGNELRRREDHRFVCAICMGGFSNRLQWNIHRALLRGVQRLYECTRCKESFSTEAKLATHETVGGCRQQEDEDREEDKAIDARLALLRKDLILRILKAKATDGLVRINEEEHDAVLENKGAFLDRLHRNELKHSRKRVKLFYVCEACSFRTEIRDELQTHLEIGTCMQGFYIALGFCVVNLRYVQSLECESCGYRTESTANLRRHQLSHNHSGIRKTLTTRQVAEREYPCEYCGKILTSTFNRKRHRSTCLHMVKKTIPSEPKEPESIEDVTVDGQLLDAPQLEEEECGEQQEPLVTEIKIEEYDPLDALIQNESDREQETEPPTDKVKQYKLIKKRKKRSPNGRARLICPICSYATSHRGNLNRHLQKKCLKNVPPKQSTYFGSSESESDPLDALIQNVSDREQETEPLTEKVKQDKPIKRVKKRAISGRTVLICSICRYSTTHRPNLTRHLKNRCLKNLPPNQANYFSSSEPKHDPLDALILNVKDREQETEPLTEEVKQDKPIEKVKKRALSGRTVLICSICRYSTTHRPNLKRHLQKKCLKSLPPDQASYFNSSKPAYDPLDALILKANDQEQEIEPLTHKVKRHKLIKKVKKRSIGRTVFICSICSYSTTHSPNLKRHLKNKCLKNLPPNQSTYFGSSGSKNDPLDALILKATDREQETEPLTETAKRDKPIETVTKRETMLICPNCSYSTNRRGNLNRHLKNNCLKNVPPNESTYSGSPELE